MKVMTDCSLVDGELDLGFGKQGSSGERQELSEGARRHLDACERCRALYRWAAQAPPPAEVPPQLSGRVRSALEASLAPVRPMASARVLVVWFLGAFALFAALAGGMLGLAGLRVMNAAQLLVVSAVLAMGIILLSLSLAWQMTPGNRRRLPALIALAVLAGGFLAAVGLLFPWRASGAFLAQDWRCFRAGIGMALPVAALFWLFARRGAPLSAELLGTTIGAIAGLAGVTVLQFTCSLQQAGHLLLGHGSVLVVSAILGLLTGRVMGRFRARRG
jgi:hypothetical protein